MSEQSKQPLFLSRRFIIFMLVLSGLSLWLLSILLDLTVADLFDQLAGGLWFGLALWVAALIAAALWAFLRRLRLGSPKEVSEIAPSTASKASRK